MVQMYLKNKHLIYNHEAIDYILSMNQKGDLEYCSRFLKIIQRQKYEMQPHWTQ